MLQELFPPDGLEEVPPSPRREPLSITTSAQSSFRECPRKYHYQYKLRRTPVKASAALRFGTAWHGAMENYWLHGREAAIAWLSENAAADMDVFEAAKLAAMFAHYNPPIGDYEVISAETNFRVPIVNPETGRRLRSAVLEGRTDVELIHKATGRKLVLDHKTSGEDITGFSPFWQRLQIDAQIGNYGLATGTSGFIYDVAKKPALRPGKNETPDSYEARCSDAIAADLPAYYQFRLIERTEEDQRQAAWDLWQSSRLMVHAEANGYFPRHSNACRGFYGVCPFLNVCSGLQSINDNEAFRTKADANEELKK